MLVTRLEWELSRTECETGATESDVTPSLHSTNALSCAKVRFRCLPPE